MNEYILFPGNCLFFLSIFLFRIASLMWHVAVFHSIHASNGMVRYTSLIFFNLDSVISSSTLRIHYLDHQRAQVLWYSSLSTGQAAVLWNDQVWFHQQASPKPQYKEQKWSGFIKVPETTSYDTKHFYFLTWRIWNSFCDTKVHFLFACL